MVNALLLGCGLLAVSPPDRPSSEQVLAAYQDAKAQAKRDPESQVRLALWCEAHGLTAERLKHLARALLADPGNATARGLLGLVKFRDEWKKPDDVAAAVHSDAQLAAALAEYNTKRATMGSTADSHWRLGLWCEQHGLQAEATAHFTAVTRLDPSRDAAWKKLGCKKQNGRWMTEAQIAAAKADTDAQKQANRHWFPLLEKWKTWLGQKSHHDDAERNLIKVTDPRAVPAVWRVFALGEARDQARAVQLLGQIDAPAASQALVYLAVFGRSDEVRRAAVETLTRRDSRDFLDLVINLIRKPLRYEVKPVGGPGSPGALFVEGQRYNVHRNYAPPAVPEQTLQLINETMMGVFTPHDQWEYEALEGKGGNNQAGNTLAAAQLRRYLAIAQNLSEAQRAAVSAERQLESDVKQLETYNSQINQTNQQSLFILSSVTDQDLGADRQAWTKWWTDQQGYAYEPPPETPKPTLYLDEQVPLAYVPSYVYIHHSCFGAGTLVRTLDGMKSIESIGVGDQVLTQNTTTGALSFQPVLSIFHNRPAPTYKVQFDGETIVATGIHRFWKAGQGWAMARDLKSGDHIRTLDGLARVSAVETKSVQPVFNLEVAEGHSFFVGKTGLLVHDNSLVRPALHPFDAPPEVAARPSQEPASH